MIYGYIRVSTDKQDCENQKLGIESKASALGLCIDKYIEDAGISGTKEPEQRALGLLMQSVVPGDVVIISELSRFGRRLFMLFRPDSGLSGIIRQAQREGDDDEAGNEVA